MLGHQRQEPIEHLWIRIKHLRAIADAGGEPFSDSTIMRLNLSALEQAGVYSHNIQTWRDHAEMDHTWVNFCCMLIRENYALPPPPLPVIMVPMLPFKPVALPHCQVLLQLLVLSLLDTLTIMSN